MKQLILASKSPRREELLKKITDDFEIIVSDVDEVLPADITAEEAPVYLAALKANAVAREHPGSTVIGADTVVILDDVILGKPKDEADAFSMLRALSGKTHTVITGCCITDGQREQRFFDSTQVTFYKLSDREIMDYIATGDPMDKAGSYGIQEKATLFVRGIEGDFFNVMGLPIAKLYRELKKFEVNGK
ncbi:MAG: septum formation inhibitor Maf [Ruminococcus sp.]|nr:septum formation inhibitor Maf [Ruminococcus sp.]